MDTSGAFSKPYGSLSKTLKQIKRNASSGIYFRKTNSTKNIIKTGRTPSKIQSLPQHHLLTIQASNQHKLTQSRTKLGNKPIVIKEDPKSAKLKGLDTQQKYKLNSGMYGKGTPTGGQRFFDLKNYMSEEMPSKVIFRNCR